MSLQQQVVDVDRLASIYTYMYIVNVLYYFKLYFKKTNLKKKCPIDEYINHFNIITLLAFKKYTL
jgi:hypothetical protein